MSIRELSIGIVVGSISRAAGGLFNSVRYSAIALSRAGAEVTVYSLADDHSERDLLEWKPLVPRVFSVRGPRGVGYAPELGESLNREDHSLLHLHGIWQHLSVQCRKWRRRTGRPFMISPRGMLDPWAIKNSAWRKRIALSLFEKSNLREATCLHALNAAEAAAFRMFGLENPIAIIPNGVEVTDLNKGGVRPRWLPDDGRRTLLYLGRLHPKKGLRPLLEAWGSLNQTMPALTEEWRLVVAGWDQNGHRAQLERLVAKNNLQNSVIFPGSVYGEDKLAILSHADAFILPSLSEGLPMGVLEAWSHSLPVLMTAHCNIPEGFEVDAAIRIEPDPISMAAQMGLALSDPTLAARGKRGRELVRGRFNWDRIADMHLAVYRWMRDGGTPPDCVDFHSTLAVNYLHRVDRKAVAND